MSSDTASLLIIGLLPLVGAGLGATATIAVQRSTTRASGMRFAAETRLARREEIKTALLRWLNAGRARSRGGQGRCSEAVGEFVERDADPIVFRQARGQVIVSAAQILDERVPGSDGSR